MTDRSIYENPARQPIDDIDLAAAISALLHSRDTLKSILVGATDGIVTLEGSVGSAEDRDNIEALVRRFAGVRDVANAITLEANAATSTECHADRPVSE